MQFVSELEGNFWDFDSMMKSGKVEHPRSRIFFTAHRATITDGGEKTVKPKQREQTPILEEHSELH